MKLGFNEEVVTNDSDHSDYPYYACVPDPARPDTIVAAWWLNDSFVSVGVYKQPQRRAGMDLADCFARKLPEPQHATIRRGVENDPLAIQLAIFHLIQTHITKERATDEAA